MEPRSHGITERAARQRRYGTTNLRNYGFTEERRGGNAEKRRELGEKYRRVNQYLLEFRV